MTRERVRVLVVDDQELIREGIASLLAIQEGIEVVGTAGNGREAIEMAVAASPDVVLMDVRMPEMDGVQALALLRQRAPGCRVVMLTTFDDEEYVVQALRAGPPDTCSRTCRRGNSPPPSASLMRVWLNSIQPPPPGSLRRSHSHPLQQTPP